MLNLFGTANPTVDATIVNANAAISTLDFLSITNIKHPAVQEMLDSGELDFEFLSWENYVARRNHAYDLWEVHYLAEEARKRKIGLARAKARREAEIKQAFSLESRVRLVIKTKQSA